VLYQAIFKRPRGLLYCHHTLLQKQVKRAIHKAETNIEMIDLLLAVQLNIGVYYTFPEKYESVEKEIVTQDIKGKVKNMLREAEKEINNQVFGGQQAIQLNPVFIEYWHENQWPMYSDKNISSAVNADRVWPMLERQKLQKNIDIYLVLFAEEIAYFDIDSNKMKLAGWVFAKGNKVAASKFMQSEEPHQSLLHELGHWLNLEHENCTLDPLSLDINVMCEKKYPGKIYFTASYKKAWRDFYERG